MFDFPGNPLQLLKGLWGTIPLKLLVLIAVGLFVLSAIGSMSFVRSQIGSEPMTILARYLATGVDAALIVLVALLVTVAIAAVIYAVCYRER